MLVNSTGDDSTLQELQQRVSEREKEGWSFVHPFDDPSLFEGYATAGIVLLRHIHTHTYQ